MLQSERSLWLTSADNQPIRESLQAPFQARHNYESVQRLIGQQNKQYRHWSLNLWARSDSSELRKLAEQHKQKAHLPLKLNSANKSVLPDSLPILTGKVMAAILQADSACALYQPRRVAQYLIQADTQASRLVHHTQAPRRNRLKAHEHIAGALSLESAFLERQAQEYYSLLLGQLQIKGRLWLVVFLNLLLWGWAVLRVVDEGYYREWKARQTEVPPTVPVPVLPLAEEQVLLQQFAFIAFGLLVPLLNPVKPESIALDKPLWSLTLPSFVRNIVQSPSGRDGDTGATGRAGTTVYIDTAVKTVYVDTTERNNKAALTLEDLKKMEDSLKSFILQNRPKRIPNADE